MSVKELVTLLAKEELTIASCESVTAGLFSATIASIAGASKVLLGGFVTYHTEIKEKIAHVDPQVIAHDGVISAACAKEMAVHTKELIGSDLCVSFTGNAGPSAMEGKPAGCIYCAIASPWEISIEEFNVQMERNALRAWVVAAMAQKVMEHIKIHTS